MYKSGTLCSNFWKNQEKFQNTEFYEFWEKIGKFVGFLKNREFSKNWSAHSCCLFWNLSWIASTTPLEDNVKLSKSQVGQCGPVLSKSQQLKSHQIVSSRQKSSRKNLTRKSNPLISMASCSKLKKWINVKIDIFDGIDCQKFNKTW